MVSSLGLIRDEMHNNKGQKNLQSKITGTQTSFWCKNEFGPQSSYFVHAHLQKASSSLFGCNKQRECEGDVLFTTGCTQRTLPFNLFCFLLCFQASPLLLFFQVSNQFFLTPLSIFLGIYILGTRRRCNWVLGEHWVFQAQRFSLACQIFLLKVFQKLFQLLAHHWFFTLQRLAKGKYLLCVNTFWVVLFGIQGLAHFPIITRLPPQKTQFNRPHS